MKLTRRKFMVQTASLCAAAPLLQAAENVPGGSPVLGFIKPFQKLGYSEIADISSEVGWDGIECPVRQGGTIEPLNVEDELPKLVDILRKNKSDVTIIATDVEDANAPLTRRVLSTAAKLGIKQYRMKHLYYDLNRPIEQQLAPLKTKLRDLAALNRELNLQGTIQNHSGKNYVGAPVWDIWELLREVDSKYLATYFDIGHATLEGGYSWPIQARLIRPSLAVVSVKDFVWTRNAATNRWNTDWCPIGEGLVQPEFFKYLKSTRYAGPICQHFEYEIGQGKAMIHALKKDQETLKQWLRNA